MAQKLILIGQRPPHVTVGAVPGGHVPDVPQIVLHGHLGESPAVVGMEKNQIGLYAKFHEPLDCPVMNLEKHRVEAGEVPVISRGISVILTEIIPCQCTGIHRCTFEGKCSRVVKTEVIMLRHNAETHLVKVTFFQFCKGFFYNRLFLQVKGIACGAERIMRRAVRIGKLVLPVHMYRAMVIPRRGSCGKGAGIDFLRERAGNLVMVFSLV